MQIHIMKDALEYGPFSQAETVNRILSGEFTGNDQGWTDDPSQLMPLSKIIARAPADTAPEKKRHSALELIQMAAAQRSLIGMLSALILLTFLPLPPQRVLFYQGVSVALWVLSIISSARLARILGKNIWLWLFLTFVPFVNLVALARLIHDSRRVRTAYGLVTRITGVSQRDLARIASDNPTAESQQQVGIQS